MQEVLLIALVVLLFFGGRKIPELMKGIGKGVRSFKEGMNGMEKEISPENTDKKRSDMAKEDKTDGLNFWEHLDVLRTAIVKIVAVAVVFGIAAFCFKENFCRYPCPEKRRLHHVPSFQPDCSMGGGETGSFAVQLINTGLAGQFVIHMKTALCAGVLCASPYILYQLFRFVSPALYACERKYAVRIVGGGYAMFLMGVAVSYFLIFPLTFRFLGTYQVSGEVENMIVLQSYISTLVLMCLTMGIVFEIPILSWLFAKLGFLTADFMRRYRKHAIVIILIVAAVITPTSDVFTLSLVTLPMWVLYEASILVVNRAASKKAVDR